MPSSPSFPISISRSLLLRCALGILGILLLVPLLLPGSRLSRDSVIYLEAAQSVAEGRGFEIPGSHQMGSQMTHFPPLFPLVLAPATLLDSSATEFYRWLAPLLLALCAVLVFCLARRTGAGNTAATMVAVTFLLAPWVLAGFRILLTESLFLTLLLSSVVLFSRFLDCGSAAALTLSALLIGPATITRYAGLPFVAILVLACWLFAPQRRRRLACWTAMVGGAPLLLWLLRNQRLEGGITNRSLTFHPLSTEQIDSGLRVVGNWLLPAGLRLPSMVAFALASTGVSFCWLGVGELPAASHDHARPYRHCS